MYEVKQLLDFNVAHGYLSRGYSYISDAEIKPHGYSMTIDNGYSIYYKYLHTMLAELSAKNIDVYVYRFPWPESRQHEKEFNNILDHYWAKLKSGNFEGSTVHFIDDLYFWPNKYFVDPLHLNHAGAVKLTATLAKQIAASQR